MAERLNRLFKLVLALAGAGACFVTLGCSRASEVRQEERPPPPETRPTPWAMTARDIPSLPPPKPEEVGKAVRRVFRDAVMVDSSRSPYFTVGDFNGDLSQDLAVVVKPSVTRLTEINDELANWILVEPRRSHLVRSRAEMVRLQPRTRVNDGDILLAVIHGFEFSGWRDDRATQTYVLRNAVGARMRTEARPGVVRADTKDKLPRIWGDVIAQSIDRQAGFLYYNGARYGWYDPRSSQLDRAARTVHGRALEAMR